MNLCSFYAFDFEEVAKEFGIPAQFQRFWVLGKRQNHTYRPFRPLTHIEEAGPVGQLKVVYKVHKEKFKLFLEVERGPDLCPIAPLNKGKDDVLLFFKLYDPEKEELRYVGRLFVNCTDKPSEILTRLNKLAGYDPDEEIELYEEIMFEPNVMCESVDKKLTFQESELENGDIICFQKASGMVNEKHFRYPDVPSYLEYVHNGQVPYSLSAKETTHDESSSKFNTSEFVSIDSEEIDAMIDEDVIAAIDRVLSKGITISLKSHSQHSVQGQQEVAKMDHELPKQLLQELRDIAFKEDLVEKYKEGLTPKVNFNVLKDKIDANADLFSSHQLEQVSMVVNLLNNIVRVFEKHENLKKERDLAKKSTGQDNEALKETRQKILT
ncbi:ubiquitin carboxyl-terminal hydrolase family protein, partial [Trifolium medium]|nr:ubiquitin carboxyl-terminal hydrolase family protein [Trifolium medium]